MVVTRSGLKYVDKRIGGGAPVQPRLLMILDYRFGGPIISPAMWDMPQR